MKVMNATPRPIAVLLAALGGEGGGVLSEWLYEAAVSAGHSAQSTSIPGVAQRTGATTYYVEIFPQPDSLLDARRPVFSLNPVPGAIDLLVSSELLETVRQIGLGMSNAERTMVITSSARALTVAEKMQPADGRMNDATLLSTVRRYSSVAAVLDMGALAREAGTAISAVLFGAIAATGLLPLSREHCEATIRRGGKGVQASLEGFALGFDALQAALADLGPAPATAHEVEQDLERAQASTPERASRREPERATGREPERKNGRDGDAAIAVGALQPALAQRFPARVHELLALGHARVEDYQDAAYADLYVQRLGRVLEAERRADAAGFHDWSITQEVARWLALWMAFDDIVRVAHLKLRASRHERVRREVGARDDEIVKVYDHFKPGVPEFAALLPQRLADRLTAWDRRRQSAGHEPWSKAMKIGAHTVHGALMMRLLASMKGQRRRGSRFALEQSLIEQWLAAVTEGADAGWSLGHELAQCGRLVKGYGSTNERGKRNLLHIVEHVAVLPGATPEARADAVRASRLAALADDAGTALDQTLQSLGAPPRAPREQPIRWYKRRPMQTVESQQRQSGGVASIKR